MTIQDVPEATAPRDIVSVLSQRRPHYCDMAPLPQAAVALFEPYVVDYSVRRKSPLVIRRFEDDAVIGGRRVPALQWLYQLSGAFAPAQLTRLRAAICPDDGFSPKLHAVHFRELAASLWESSVFPRLFEGHDSEWHLFVSVALEGRSVTVQSGVRLARVGPEFITGPLEGLNFIDEAVRTVERRWSRFCHESRFWLAASGIDKLALKGTTAAIPDRMRI
jgi:hypothetical protein